MWCWMTVPIFLSGGSLGYSSPRLTTTMCTALPPQATQSRLLLGIDSSHRVQTWEGVVPLLQATWTSCTKSHETTLLLMGYYLLLAYVPLLRAPWALGGPPGLPRAWPPLPASGPPFFPCGSHLADLDSALALHTCTTRNIDRRPGSTREEPRSSSSYSVVLTACGGDDG